MRVDYYAFGTIMRLWIGVAIAVAAQWSSSITTIEDMLNSGGERDAPFASHGENLIGLETSVDVNNSANHTLPPSGSSCQGGSRDAVPI